MDFLFTQENDNLQVFKNECLSENVSGAYILVGKSGSGKTAFLKYLDGQWKENMGKQVAWLHVEDIVSSIMEKEDLFSTMDAAVFILDNMEELVGKENTIAIFWDVLECWLNEGQHLFIGVTNSERMLIPSYVKLLIAQGITITLPVVSALAKAENIQFSDEEMMSLCEKAEGSFSRLIGIIKREKLFKNIT
ncbi:MAG: hypothetical protein IJP29_02230 [Lachnospiraceae bacterium]|nr:hypothetical protein [Lachnospiraceae bacterium]